MEHAFEDLRFRKRFVNRIWKPLHRHDRRDLLQVKAERIAEINANAIGGRVGIAGAGMDCDCSKWSGPCGVVPATYYAVDRALDRIYEGLDGPANFWLIPPDEAEEMPYQSRDLALEAFEDGHPHVVYA